MSREEQVSGAVSSFPLKTQLVKECSATKAKPSPLIEQLLFPHESRAAVVHLPFCKSLMRFIPPLFPLGTYVFFY